MTRTSGSFRRPAPHVGSEPAGQPRRRFGRSALVGGFAIGLLAALFSLPPGTSSTASAADAEPLLVVDVKALSIEEQLTFASLQGIVNRDAPRLYLVGLRNAQDFSVDPTAEEWLADTVDLPFERVTPAEALARLIGEVKGMVVWDPAVPYESQNVATTIAGRDDLLPVGPAQALKLAEDHGLAVEMDLRELDFTTDRQFTEWAIAKLEPPPGGWAFPVWTGRPRNANPIQPGLRDWAVANRAFVFDADPSTEPELIGQVLDLFPRGTGVYGYVFFDTKVYYDIGLPANEALGVAELTDRGDWLIPTTDATNMTVHARSPESPRLPDWDDAPRTPDKDTTYVSFVISDGDALGYDITLLRSLQYPHLGADSIPIGISTSPLLATHAPALWNWYLDNLPANASLVAGPSGSGYFYPSYASEADEDRFLQHSRADLDATGLRSTWSINPILTPSPSTGDVRRMVDAFAPSSLYLDYTPAAPISPAVSFTDDVPVARMVMVSSPGDIAPAIRASIARQPDGPRFVSIGLVTWNIDADDAAAALAEFGDDVVAVAPDEYAGLLRGAAAHGYTGTPDRPTIPIPAVGTCRADLDQIDWGTYPVVAAFVASQVLKNDLRAGATADETTMQVDAQALAAEVLAMFRALGPFAFSSDAIASGTVTAGVEELDTPLDVGDGVVEATGRYSFAITFNPGDGTRTSSLSAPVTCRAAVTPTPTTTSTSTSTSTSTTTTTTTTTTTPAMTSTSTPTSVGSTTAITGPPSTSGGGTSSTSTSTLESSTTSAGPVVVTTGPEHSGPSPSPSGAPDPAGVGGSGAGAPPQPSPASGELARTGAPAVSRLAWLGWLLVALGLSAVLVARQRRVLASSRSRGRQAGPR